MKVQLNLLIIATTSVFLRLWGNFTVLYFLKIDPRKIHTQKKFIHWILSILASTIIFILSKYLYYLYNR